MFTKLSQKSKTPARLSSPPKPPSSPSRPTVPPVLDLERYLQTRDFAAALTLLRVQQRQHQEEEQQQKSKGSRISDSLTKQQQHPEVRFWRRNTWWRAYCDFQQGEIRSALAGFEALLHEDSGDGGGVTNIQYEDPFVARDRISWQISRACCLLYLQDFDNAEQQAMVVPRDALCNRLLFLLAHEKTQNLHKEDKNAVNTPAESALLLDRYSRLSTQSSVRDQLAVAFSSFARRNFTEAVDAYKQVLAARSKDAGAAVHVYLALCYFRLEYYDVAAELLATYLESKPNSFFVTNIKASCHFHLYGADAALHVLDDFAARFPHHPTSGLAESVNVTDHEYLSSCPVLSVAIHNRIIFRQCSTYTVGKPKHLDLSAPSIETTLKQLIDTVPEARLNLSLQYLRNRSNSHAIKLLNDVEPAIDPERLIKAAVFALIGEASDIKEHIFVAEKLYNTVGSSPESVDTIPGRQSMASYFILRREFTDALVYLESIETYLSPANASFNWNYGLCLAIIGSSSLATDSTTIKYFQKAQECFERARRLNIYLAHDKMLISWLTRCYIRGDQGSRQNGSHIRGWELFLEFQQNTNRTEEVEEVLKVVANDLYRSRRFFLAARAFDILEQQQNPVDPEIWEAKRGACVGFFQQVATGEEQDLVAVGDSVGKKSAVPLRLATRADEVLAMLARSKNTLEASKLTAMLKKWVATLKL